MVGNSAEEGLMLQVDNPSHLDPGRIAVPLGLVTTAVTYVATSAILPGLGLYVTLLIAFGIGSLAGVQSYRWVNNRRLRREAAAMQTARDQQAEQQDKALKAID